MQILQKKEKNAHTVPLRQPKQTAVPTNWRRIVYDKQVRQGTAVKTVGFN